MSLSRHEIRTMALQALFVLSSNSDAAINSVLAAVVQKDHNDDDVLIPAYLSDLVNAVMQHTEEIDAKIEAHLKAGWTLSRLSRVDLVILRLAIAEKNFTAPNLSAKVIINEALQLSRTFSDEKTRPFINAVLQKVIGD